MRWKPIPGYEEFYEVSSSGDVRSLDRECGARGGGIALRRGRTLKQVLKPNGYLCVTLTAPGKREQIATHRLVLAAFRGIATSHQVHTRHRDGTKTNNRLGNIKHGTPRENAEDKKRHGTLLRGIDHGGSKLNESQVRRIRACTTTAQACALAIRFGVSHSRGWAIYNRKGWTHI